MDVNWVMIAMAITRVRTLAARATQTSARPLGSRFNHGRQMNRL